MDDSDEGVVLTEREREELAKLASALDDPWLALQLAGNAPPSPDERPAGWLWRWVGAILIVLGGAVAVATFTRWLLVAAVGIAAMAAGGWLLWDSRPEAEAASG